MSEQPTEYGKELIAAVTDAMAGAIIDAGGTIDYRVQSVARAALLAACAKLKEPTLEMGEAGIASLGSDDDRHPASIAGDVWDAMLSQLLTEIGI